MEKTYDLEKIKKIYLNADGGSWIKSGRKQIAGITFVLDEFHIKKYLRKIVRERKGNKEGTIEELCKIIRTKTKKDFEIKVEEWKQEAASAKEGKRIEEGPTILYLIGQQQNFDYNRKKEN